MLEKIKTTVESVFEAQISYSNADRKRSKVDALKAFAYLSLMYSGKGVTDIGRFINRDHSTIIYHTRNKTFGCMAIAKIDSNFRRKLEKCKIKINEK